MVPLAKTDLTASQKTDLAAAALAQQGVKGAVTELSRKYGISRPSVYSVRHHAHHALSKSFAPLSPGELLVTVEVDDNQLQRALTALRVCGKNSIEDIRELLPVIYPGLSLSHGTLHGRLAEAEGRAAEFNSQAEFAKIRDVALDELFSQRAPVLAGIDLASGYVFGLALKPTRSADDWADFLRVAQKQGLSIFIRPSRMRQRGSQQGFARCSPPPSNETTASMPTTRSARCWRG